MPGIAPACSSEASGHKVDGDELNLTLLNDDEMRQKLTGLAPYMSAMDVSKPRSVSRNLLLPAPMIATLLNWMFKGE